MGESIVILYLLDLFESRDFRHRGQSKLLNHTKRDPIHWIPAEEEYRGTVDLISVFTANRIMNESLRNVCICVA